MAMNQRRAYPSSSFSMFASQYFQNGVQPFFEKRPSLQQPLLYLDNSIDQMAALGIWRTIFAFMQNVQPPPRFRYQSQPKVIFKDAIREIEEIFRWRKASFTQSRLLVAGPGGDSTNLEKVHFIVGLGIIRETLRDEIICQIVKQCVSNPSEVSVSRGWILLALTLGCFAPSEKLVRCLIAFFREENTEHSKFCQQLLARTLKNGPRKQPPAYSELNAANTLKMISLPVAFMDGTVKNIEVDAQVTGEELREIIAKKVGLVDQFGFSIFCAIDNNVRSVGGGKEHIMDYVSQCEQFGKETGHSERVADWKLYFAKEIFAPWHDPSEDNISTELIYRQITRGIKHGEYKCETKQELAEIAANEHFLTYGHHFDRSVLVSQLPSYLPDKALEGDGMIEKWADMIEDSFKQISGYYSADDNQKVRENIVTSARLKWPFVFSRSFDVRQVSGPALPRRSVVLSINWKGVYFYDDYDNTLLYLRYRDIVQIQAIHRRGDSSEDDVLLLSTTKKGKYGFASENATTISDILIYIWDGLRRRSRYCIALFDYPGDRNSNISLRRGDIILLDKNNSGKSLHSTGRAFGTNERTGQRGNVSSRSVYVVPVVDTSIDESVNNKPEPRPFKPELAPEIVMPTSSKAEVDELMVALESKDRKLHSVEEKIVLLEGELNQLGRDKQENETALKNEKETSQTLLERKETLLVTSKTEMDNMRQYNNQASAKLSDMQKLLRDQEGELETVRNQRYTQLTDLKNKESALFTNRARLVELEKHYTSANTEVEDLRGRVHNKETELVTVRREQHQNILLIAEMEGSLNAAQKELESFEKQQVEAATTIKQMRRTLENQEISIESLKTERDAHFSELQNKEMLLSSTRSELLRLKEENNEASITIRELRTKIQDQEEELRMLRMQRTEQTSVTSSQIQDLERSVGEKNVKISYLMEERDKNIEKHRDEIRELEKRLSTLSSQHVEVRQTTVKPPEVHVEQHVQRTIVTSHEEPRNRLHTLEVYARDYFTDNITWVHQKELIAQPLHKVLLRSQEKKEKATNIFKLILIYMGELPGRRDLSQLQLTDEIFGPALDEELLRDEIFCQILKQLTFNSNAETGKNCWELLWLCTGLFSPSNPALTRHVEMFLKSSKNPTSNACYTRLQRVSKFGPRRAPPHYMETEAAKGDEVPIYHKFYLPDDTEVIVEIESLSKPPSIVQSIAKMLELKTSEGFGIFVRVNQQVLGISETEYLFDFLWLLASLGSNTPTGIDYELFVTKKVWSKTIAGDDVKADCVFHYYQELPRYQLGYHKCSHQEAIEMSGLAYRVYHGEGARPSDEFPNLLDDIVPISYRGQMSDSEWVQSLMAEHRKNPGMTKAEAKVAFLNKMQGWPTFGAVFFEAQQEISQEFPPIVLVAINKHGINLIHPETKDLLKNYSYSLISHWRSGDETFEVIVGGIDGRRIVFRTHLDYEMDDLLTAYVAFYSEEREAESLHALWSQTVRDILRKQITTHHDEEPNLNS